VQKRGINGILYSYPPDEELTATIPAPYTSGLYYFYISGSGSLEVKNTYFTWEDDTPVAYVYWNNTYEEAFFFADERHGITMDWATHEYLHRTRGAAIANGFGANNYTTTGLGTSDSDAQIDIADGTFFDEDLQIDITHSATPTANTWEQVLQGAAEIPVFYKTGTGEWVADTATEFPLKEGLSRPAYNLFSGGTWTTPDISNNHFGVSYILATNNLNYPIITILGQGDYGEKGAAESSLYEDLNLDDFPVVEFRPLYKLIYECKDSYTNTPHAAFREVTDLRSIISGGFGIPTVPVSDHGNMTGLADDDHTQYLNATRHNTTDHSEAMQSVVLNDISDVVAATPSSDQVLAWNGSQWIAKTFTASVATLDSVGDVNVPSPTSGSFLSWDGFQWKDQVVELGNNTTGNYVSDVTAGTGVTVTHTPGEGSSASIAIGQAVGTSDSVDFASVTTSSLTAATPNFTGPTTITGSLTLNGSNIPPITVSSATPSGGNDGDVWLVVY
jgi:hypothetical protein